MTWYEIYWSAGWVSMYIHDIDYVRETDHTIFTKTGKIQKSKKYSRFFSDIDEAKAFGTTMLMDRMESIKEQLHRIKVTG